MLRAFLAIVAAVGYGTYRYAQTRAFLVAENGTVVVYQGVPGEIAGLETFGKDDDDDHPGDFSDAESFFNLPQGDDDDDEDEAPGR